MEEIKKPLEIDSYACTVSKLERLKSNTLADTQATDLEILAFLRIKLKSVKHAYVSENSWKLQPKKSEKAAVFEEIIPLLTEFFTEFLTNSDKIHFVVPIMPNSVHHCGLMISKEKVAENIQLKYTYFNPETCASVPSPTDKEVFLAIEDVNTKIFELFANIYITQEGKSYDFEGNTENITIDQVAAIKTLSLQEPTKLNLDNKSCQQQTNNRDCGYITGQTLYELATNLPWSIPIYDPQEPLISINAIAKARANFGAEEIVGETRIDDYVKRQYYQRLTKAMAGAGNSEDGKQFWDCIKELKYTAEIPYADFIKVLQEFIAAYDLTGLPDARGTLKEDKLFYFLSASKALKKIASEIIKTTCEHLLEPKLDIHNQQNVCYALRRNLNKPNNQSPSKVNNNAIDFSNKFSLPKLSSSVSQKSAKDASVIPKTAFSLVQGKNIIDDSIYTKPGYLTEVEIISSYKNLPAGENAFVWQNIPMFSVITGKNGTGKTTILEAMLFGFEKNQGQIKLTANPNKHNLTIISLHNNNLIGSLRSSIEEDAKKNFVEKVNKDFEQLKRYSICKQFNRPFGVELKEGKKQFYDEIISKALDILLNKEIFNAQLYEAELRKQFDKQTEIHIVDYTNINVLAKKIFEGFFYRFNSNPISETDKKTCLEKALSEINIYLKNNKFKYQFSDKSFSWSKNQGEFDCLALIPFDESSFIMIGDSIALNPPLATMTIHFANLSSGERLELLLLLWKLDNRVSFENTILLMDEPDGHLHPSAVKGIMDIIQKKIVQEWGIQVIMTTHSPTTVSLVPKDCLWVLENEPPLYHPKIRRVSNKKEAIRLLTAEFVCVNEPFRLVFVEAPDDKKFYQAVLNNLIMMKSVNPNEQIVFMMHSKNKKNSSRDLVISIVENCVEDTHDADKSLRDHVFGIVDGDNKPKPNSSNVFALERYSIENYIYDPVYLFFLMREKKLDFIENITALVQKITNSEIPASLGELLRMNDLDKRSKILQTIIDILTDRFIEFVEKNLNAIQLIPDAVDPANKGMDKQSEDDFNATKKLLTEPRFKHLIEKGKICTDKKIISFQNGTELKYPKFVLEMRGHNLEYLYIKFFEAEAAGKKNSIDKGRILNVICKEAMLVPLELEKIFKDLQAPITHADQKTILPQKALKVVDKTSVQIDELNKQDKAKTEKIRNQAAKIKELNKKIISQGLLIDELKKQNERTVKELEEEIVSLKLLIPSEVLENQKTALSKPEPIESKPLLQKEANVYTLPDKQGNDVSSVINKNDSAGELMTGIGKNEDKTEILVTDNSPHFSSPISQVNNSNQAEKRGTEMEPIPLAEAEKVDATNCVLKNNKTG